MRKTISVFMHIARRGTFKERLKRDGTPWSAWYCLRVPWREGLTQREPVERIGLMRPNTMSALSRDAAASLTIESARRPAP